MSLKEAGINRNRAFSFGALLSCFSLFGCLDFWDLSLSSYLPCSLRTCVGILVCVCVCVSAWTHGTICQSFSYLISYRPAFLSQSSLSKSSQLIQLSQNTSLCWAVYTAVKSIFFIEHIFEAYYKPLILNGLYSFQPKPSSVSLALLFPLSLLFSAPFINLSLLPHSSSVSFSLITNNLLMRLNKNPRTVNLNCYSYLVYWASSSSIFPIHEKRKPHFVIPCKYISVKTRIHVLQGAFTTNIRWYFYGNNKTLICCSNSSWKANTNGEWGEEDEQMDKLLGRQTEWQRVIASPHHFWNTV